MIMQVLTEEVKLGGESLAAYKKSAQSVFAKASPDKSELDTAIEAFLRYDENIGRSPATVETNRHLLHYWQSFLQEQKIEELTAVTPQVVANYQTWIFNYKTRFGKPFGLQSQIVILNTCLLYTSPSPRDS